MIVEIAGIDFPITFDLENSLLSGTVPSELVLRELRLEVDKYDGYMIKDSDLDRWRVNDIDIQNLTHGGVTLRVSVNLKHRKQLVSAFNKTYYSSWIGMVLNGTAEFAASVRDNIINVSYRSHDIQGEKWYSEVVSLLANDLCAKKIGATLNKSLAHFDGVSIASFLKEGQVIDGGVIKTPLKTLLNEVSASVDIIPEGVNFVIKFPSEVIVT